MKKIVFTLSLLLLFAVFAGSEDVYNLVSIDISGPIDLEKITSTGIEIIKVKKDLYAEAVARDSDIVKLQTMGIFPQILIGDMEAHYKNEMTGDGIFGNYLTYSEALSSMDSVSAAYPGIVSPRVILPNNTGNNTWDGNQVWAIKVSDNVSVQEDEPEVLICALHHAREPIGTSICIYFLHWLTDNYGTDDDATWIVDNRQVWIVPMVNPDGYLYNETTSGYGGMWRKNRRNSGGGNYGVDPNRNYSYMWGYDNSGSSPDPSSDTYRGPSAASEPEVQSMINFFRAHAFGSCIDYHSHSQLYLYPWGYINQPTADHWKFDSLTNMMAASNGYQCGRPGQLLYNVNGGSFDFGYGDTLKPKVFHISPEVGTAFWQDNLIDEQIAENHLANLMTCWTAGLYLRTAGISFTDKKIDGADAQPGDTVSLILDIFNYAAFDTGFSVSTVIRSDDPYVEFFDPQASYGSVYPLQNKNNGTDLLNFEVSPQTPLGWIVNMTADISAQGGYESNSPFNLMIGTPQNGFYDDLESGSSNWTLTGVWQLRTNYSHSPTHSLGTGAYGNNQNISATMSNGVDFPVTLSFWTVYDLENGYDYGYVEIYSTENPVWTNVLSVNGEGHFTWEYKEIDISNYSSHHNVKVRFRLYSDIYVTKNGWYVDDVAILSSTFADSVPSAPSPVSPANGSNAPSSPELTVANSTDPNGLPLTYTYKVYSDSFCVNLIRCISGVAQGASGQTSCHVSPGLPVGTYYWRCYSDNGYFRSLLSEQWSFGVASSVEEQPSGGTVFSCGQLGLKGYYLELPFDCSAKIDFYDVTGRNVLTNQTRLNMGFHSFDGAPLPSGLYFVRVRIENSNRHEESGFRFNLIK